MKRIISSLLLMLIPVLTMGHNNFSSIHYIVVNGVRSIGGGESTPVNYSLISSMIQRGQRTISAQKYGIHSGFFHQVTQSSNHPPVLQPVESQTVQAGSEVSITLHATDPDGDALVFSASSPGSPGTHTVISSFETDGKWTNGTINTNEYVEGAGSFRWDHGSASSISLTANYPLDLSGGDYISIWVHNELAVANEKFTLIFYNTGGNYYEKIRTDFVGWKRFVFHKADFTVNNAPEGWHKITSIRFYASGWSNTLNPDRVVLLDDFRIDHFSLDGISPRFLASFESGSLAPDVGIEFAQQSGGSFAVVDNPSVSEGNPSEKVLLTSLLDGGRRAEYHAPRMPTQEKTYIYAWKELFPTNFGEGVNLGWGHYGVGQWKTWPCEYFGSGIYDFKDEICRGGGIFNHRLVTKTYEHEFSFRAMPDCNDVLLPMERGEWHAFALEIYWTDSSAGYYNLYKDGQLVESQAGVKTLFDGFIPKTCDMIWGMGLYAAWNSTEVSSLNYYLDDMAVFDVDEGTSIDDVLKWQQIIE